MALLCFISAFVGVSNIFYLLVCVFCMNLTTAVQDVAVDTFAISLLKPSDLGKFFCTGDPDSLNTLLEKVSV